MEQVPVSARRAASRPKSLSPAPAPPARGPALRNPQTGGREWYHGTRSSGAQLAGGFRLTEHDPEAESGGHWAAHWNALLGVHFAAHHRAADKFADPDGGVGGASGTRNGPRETPSVVHARLHLASPKHYASEHDMADDVYEHEYDSRHNYLSEHPDHTYAASIYFGGDSDHRNRVRKGEWETFDDWDDIGERGEEQPEPVYRRTQWLNLHPDKGGIVQRYKERLQAQGHDGIVYGNEEPGERVRSSRPEANLAAIAFRPDQIEITKHHLHGQEGTTAAAGGYAHQWDDYDEPEDNDTEYDTCYHCQRAHNPHEHAQEQSFSPDWEELLPRIPSVHRALGIVLPDREHALVHDPATSPGDAARVIAHHVTTAHPELGHTHWSAPEGLEHVRDSFSGSADHHRNADGTTGLSGPRVTSVVLHARTPEPEHVHTDNDDLIEAHISPYRSPEWEVPISPGAPVHLTGVSWRRASQGRWENNRWNPGEQRPWQRHDFHQPMQMEAAARWEPSSGIFGPTTGLDSRLFTPGHDLRQEVRGAVMERLDQALRTDRGLVGSDWQDYLRVYLAGGSASEWAGDRPNDTAQDLDILIGVDYDGWRGDQSVSIRPMSDAEIDAELNAALRKRFNDPDWRPEFGGRWDLTAYVNPEAWDIRVIRPYAAWDISDSRWAVRPPHLPGHSAADFDPAILSEARAVLTQARAILRMAEPNRTRQARALWEHLHAERRRAFSIEGEGWEDPGNLIEKWLAYAPGNILARIRELALAPHQKTAAVEADYSVHPDEIGYLRARDWGDTRLRDRPWEKFGDEDFERKVQEIMGTARTEGIREPVEVLNGTMHNGAHRWEAARRLNIELPIRRLGAKEPEQVSYYHGSLDEFPRGTVLTPEGKKPGGSIHSGDYVYATTSPEAARYFGSMHDDSPLTDRDVYVHRVEPVGDLESDDFRGEDERFAQGNYRAKALRILDSRKVPGHWAVKTAAAEKPTKTKDQVNYRRATGRHHCGNCVMFRLHPPDFESGACTLVRGLIDEADVCDEWYPEGKTAAGGFGSHLEDRDYQPGEHAGPFFHGSINRIEPGDAIRHDAPPLEGHGRLQHSFFTTSREVAEDAADPRDGRGHGWVHVVKPTGTYQIDHGEPDSWKSASPLRVLSVEPGRFGPRHPPPGEPWARQASGSDGDRFVTCSKGHEHWGAHGAAGLLMRHEGEDGVRYLLQKRSPSVDHPGTWSIPSGAKGKHESPEDGALREYREEMGAVPRGASHRSTVCSTDCGNWKFHTVVYDSPEMFTPRGRGETEFEVAGSGWFTPREVAKLDLHPAFSKSWDTVRKSAHRLASQRDDDEPNRAVHSAVEEHVRQAHPELDQEPEDRTGTFRKMLGRASFFMPREQADSAVPPEHARSILDLAHHAAHVMTDIRQRRDEERDRMSWEQPPAHLAMTPDQRRHGKDFTWHAALALDGAGHRDAADAARRHYADAVVGVASGRHARGLSRDFPGSNLSPDMPPDLSHLPPMISSQREGLASGDRDYHRKMLDVARNPEPGLRLWRGERRPGGEDIMAAPTVGMHWSVKPEAVITSPHVEGDSRPVVWQARLEHPQFQAIPRSHPMWHGVHQSLDNEAEVRLRPGSSVHVEGAWVGEPGQDSPVYPLRPERNPAGWKWHPVSRHIQVSHRPGDLSVVDYSDVGFPKEAALPTEAPVSLDLRAEGSTELGPADLSYSHENPQPGEHLLTATHESLPEEGIVGGAYHGPGFAGEIHWWDDGEMEGVHVRPELRRRGLATELWNRARQITPQLRHSRSQTPDGRSWAEKTAAAPAVMYHASPPRNRLGIEEHGLRADHSQDAGELAYPAVYMSPRPSEHPHEDVWRVDTSGYHPQPEGPDMMHEFRDVGGSYYVDHDVPRERLTLHRRAGAKTGVKGYDLSPRSGMIYLPVPEHLIERVPGGVEDEAHITVVYLGKGLSDEAFARALEAAAEAAARSKPLHGVLNGIDTFPPSDSSDGKVPAFVPAYVPGIGQLRQELEYLSASEHKDFRPHVCLAYLEHGDPLPPPHPARQVSFTHLHVKRGDQVVRFPLGTGMSRTAGAGDAGERLPPGRRYLYHESPASERDSIRGQGLIPHKPFTPRAGEDVYPKAVYLSEPHHSEYGSSWPGHDGPWFGYDRWRVDVSGLDVRRDPDPAHSSSWAHYDTIPPERLKLHKGAHPDWQSHL